MLLSLGRGGSRGKAWENWYQSTGRKAHMPKSQCTQSAHRHVLSPRCVTSPLLRAFWEPKPLCLLVVLLLSQLQVAEGCLALGHFSGKEGFKPGFSLCQGLASGCSPAFLCSQGVQDSEDAQVLAWGRRWRAVMVPHAG